MGERKPIVEDFVGFFLHVDVRRRGKPEVEMEVSSSSIRNRVGSVFNIGYGFLGEVCVL